MPSSQARREVYNSLSHLFPLDFMNCSITSSHQNVSINLQAIHEPTSIFLKLGIVRVDFLIKLVNVFNVNYFWLLGCELMFSDCFTCSLHWCVWCIECLPDKTLIYLNVEVAIWVLKYSVLCFFETHNIYKLMLRN